MSMFLPENAMSPSNGGVTSVTPATTETTTEDVALMQRVFAAGSRNPNLIPQDFLAYVLDWIQTQRLTIPIGQVFGFSGFTVQSSDFVGAFESTASTAYADLTTVGPTLTLGDGRYLLLLSADIDTDAAGHEAHMSYAINGASQGDTPSVQCREPNFVSCMRPSLIALKTGGDNSIVAKYRAATGIGFFGNRQMFALKYANL